MPNRILREGINSSSRINALSPWAELFYRRLLSVVDDFGRFHASPATVRAACWPTCPEKVTDAQVATWLTECAQVASKLISDCQQSVSNLISFYKRDGATYLQVNDFKQQTRSKSKFPDPAGKLISDCEQVANNLPALDVCRSPSVEGAIRSSESSVVSVQPSVDSTVQDAPDWDARSIDHAAKKTLKLDRPQTHLKKKSSDPENGTELERLLWYCEQPACMNGSDEPPDKTALKLYMLAQKLGMNGFQAAAKLEKAWRKTKSRPDLAPKGAGWLFGVLRGQELQ